jgi:hypothetical protein
MSEKLIDSQITNAFGTSKKVQLVVLDALAAWEFRHQFRWFLSANDHERKTKFIKDTLKLIRIETSIGNFTPLLTDAVISNHVGPGPEGQAILKSLFEEFLSVNCIDVLWCAEKLTFSKDLGDKIAHNFLAASIPRLLAGDFLELNDAVGK